MSSEISERFHGWSRNTCVVLAIACLLVGPVVQNRARASEGASISGNVTFDGPVPARLPIQLQDKDGKLSDCQHLHDRQLLNEDLIVGKNGAIANVFVYVKKGYHRKKYPAPPAPAVLNQVGCMFQPHVQGVMVGQDFVMKNGDPVLHNVRTLSFRNRPFNVAQPAKAPDRTKVFTRKEKAVMIQCDLHPWMKAYFFVMDHPWFSVTDTKGRFRINGLPAGEYALAAWHEELGEQDVKVDVQTSGAAEIAFSFKPKKSNVITPKAITVSPIVVQQIPVETAAPRPFVKKWNVAELAPGTTNLNERSVDRGGEVFNSAGCIKCHVIAGKGAKYGPELTEVVKRFKGRKLLEQILKPSTEINKDFETHLFVTADGFVVSGLLVKDEADSIHVLPNPLKPEDIKIIKKVDIEERRKSEVSTMPEGLLDTFHRDEILDLLAFVQSGGQTGQ